MPPLCFLLRLRASAGAATSVYRDASFTVERLTLVRVHILVEAEGVNTDTAERRVGLGGPANQQNCSCVMSFAQECVIGCSSSHGTTSWATPVDRIPNHEFDKCTQDVNGVAALTY